MDYLRVQDVTLLPDMCTGEKLLEYLKIRYENDVIYVRKCFIYIHLDPLSSLPPSPLLLLLHRVMLVTY